ncbi:hypothetical protein [Desulfococcus sp.]|uniref:hypothetical protein n=1 Tax=Desulfococcus sp. TaxID=2025834 RepID=UPI0035944046
MSTVERSGAPARQLAEAIARLFRQGIHLNDAAWHFIDSTFCHPSVEALGAILSDESDPERETLLELIFFPDADQRAALEDDIARGGFTAGDEAAVLSFLLGEPLDARLAVPGEKKILAVSVPEWAAAAFLRRLHIGRRMDPRLTEAVARFVPEAQRIRVNVGLRNSRFAQTEKKVLFLVNFFTQTAAGGEDFLDGIDFLMGFLDDIGGDVSIYRALADRKRSCFRGLRQALRFEEQLERHNIETLLLQGVRAPHVDKSDMLRQMALIDRICRTVFGRTEPVGEDSVEEELLVEETDDIAGLIRSLS